MKFMVIIAALLLMPMAHAYCDITLSINHEIMDGKVLFSHAISPKISPFIIEYWIEDEAGSIIKPRMNTTNLNKKSFTPPKNSQSIIIKSRIAEISCNNTNKEGEYAEKKVSFGKGDAVSIRFSVNGSENSQSSYFKRNEKMKGAIPFFIILALSLLSIVLIWKR